ncbi:hypothetical protein AB0J27_33975 [Micromonospora chokoriensis]
MHLIADQSFQLFDHLERCWPRQHIGTQLTCSSVKFGLRSRCRAASMSLSVMAAPERFSPAPLSRTWWPWKTSSGMWEMVSSGTPLTSEVNTLPARTPRWAR